MKKSTLSMLMSVFLTAILVLSACQSGESENLNEDNNANSEAGNDGNAGEEIVLDVWHFDPGEREKVYEDAFERFEENNPGVKVNALQIDNDDYKQRVVVAMSGGNPPDVFSSWGGGWLEEFVSSNVVKDLSNEDIDFDNFVEVALENSTFDDNVYGLPLGIATYQFFYNIEIFEEHNLEVPETYDDLLNIIDVLNDNDIHPIALANQPKWPGAFYLMYINDRLGSEDVFQEALQREGTGFDDESYVKTGEYIQDLVNRDAFNPGFNGLPYDSGQARQLIYSDNAAMLLMTSGFVNNVRDEFPEFEEKMGVFQFPVIEEGKGDPTNIAAGISPVWSIYEGTEHSELAVELIKELTSTQTAQDYMDRTSTPVVVKGVEPEDEYVKIFTEWVNEANSIQFPYDQTLPPELSQMHLDTTYELFGETLTPEEAAQMMEETAEEVLE